MKQSRRNPSNVPPRQPPQVHIVGELTDAHFNALADTLLSVAEDVVVAEDRIKRAAIAALERGDSEAALELLRRWLTEPPTDIAKRLSKARRA